MKKLKEKKIKKLEFQICPKYDEKSFIVSIFGSICNKCFYEPKKPKEN